MSLRQKCMLACGVFVLSGVLVFLTYVVVTMNLQGR